MSKKWFLLSLAMIIILACIGCGQEDSAVKPKLTIKQIEEFYPGDISMVDHIEIRSGSTGELKIVNDKQLAQDWIAKVRHVKLTPDPNQEARAGYLFAVGLYEGTEKKLAFGTNSMAGNYYLHSEELAKQISELFETK